MTENELLTDNQLQKIKKFSKQEYAKQLKNRAYLREQIFFNRLKERNIEVPEKEFMFHRKRKWRFDYCFVKLGIALEIEGGVFSGGRHTRGVGFLKDMEKYNEAVLSGYSLIRSTPDKYYTNEFIDKIEILINSKKAERNFSWKFKENRINPEILMTKDFQQKFNISYSEKPKLLNNKDLGIKIEKVHEELSEYEKSTTEKDLYNLLSELVDIQYTLNGLILHHGFQGIFNDAYSLIHDANMKKELKGGKIIKPDGWQPAELSKLK